MNIFNYFKKKGIDTIDASFYRKIDEWESWYKANVRGFSFYKVYTGKGTSVRRQRRSLHMAKKVCEDIADLLMNEKVRIRVCDEQTDRFVKTVLSENKFYRKANEYQERKSATGTAAYVANLNDMVTDEEGNVLSGKIGIDYLSARDIFPVSWKNGAVTECAFVYHQTFKRKKYVIVAYHYIETDEKGTGLYTIENTVLEAMDGSSDGKELSEEEWKKLKPFEGLAKYIKTGSERPLFVIDTLAIVNNAADDETNPMGVSLFANAIDILKNLDEKYDSYANEFTVGKRRAFVAPTMLTNVDGSPAFDPDDTFYYKLSDEYAASEVGSSGKPFEVMEVAIRQKEHSDGINDELNFLSFRCGFGTQRYKFENGAVKTATEVISVHSDLYQTIKKHETVLEDVLRNLIEIIIFLGVQINAPVKMQEDHIIYDDDGCENIDRYIKIDFDDSIIEDKDAERKNDRADQAMGAMSTAEYRAKWYNESLEEAEKHISTESDVIE